MMEPKKVMGALIITITKSAICRSFVATILVLTVGIAYGMQLHAMQRQGNPELLTKNNVSKKYSPNEFQASALKKVISIDLQNVTLEQGLKTIAQKAGLKLVYSKNIIPANIHVSLQKSATTLENVLWALLAGTDLRFGVSSNNHLVIMKRAKKDKKIVQRVQAETVSGTVTDGQSGETLPGVNILVKGTSTGTSTDNEGNFELTVESLQDTLVVSFIGYQTQEMPIDGRTTVDVTLQSQAISGDELVVIGYGTQEASNITGSISSVSSDEVSEVQASGVQDALQGRISGVNVTPQDGRPGGQMDMDIRGVSTFGNNSPLFVIDGVPVFNNRSSSGYYGEGGNNNPLATLNPKSIQSIEILKDASASAIYGARAANGVVMITTKAGHEGEPIFSVDINRGVSAVPNSKFINMMNSKQFIDFTIEAFENANMPLPISVQEPYLSQNLARETDWQDAAFNPGATQDYNFNVSGGSETARYAFSGGYLNEGGTLVNSGFKRYSARINTDFDIGESIDVGGTLNLSRSIWNGLYNPTIDFIQEIAQSAPTQPLYDEDNFGGWAGPLPQYSPVNRDNKVGRFSMLDQETTHDRVIGSAYLEYFILDNLSYRLNASADIGNNKDYIFDPRYDMDNRSNNQASLDEGGTSNDNYIIENTLNYEKVFNGVHEIAVLAGYTQQESTTRYVNSSISEFPSNDTRVIDAGTGNFGVGGSETAWGLVSQLGRINYTYDDTYNLMATIRRDGSSRFGSENQFGVFPSFSGSWNIHNESFMDSQDTFSSLRLRASWGRVGSQGIDNYAARSGIQPGYNYILGDGQVPAPAATYTTMGNSELKWETTTQTNIGVDVAVLDEDLSMTAEYYVKNTDDVLLRVPIATTSGINRNNGPFVNAGSLSNKGVEFQMDYQKSVGDFNYSIGGNISSNKNEVVSLGTSGEPIIHNVIVGWATAQMTTITRPGDAMGSFYGYIDEGIFRDQAEVDNHATQEAGTAPGDVKFRDLDGDGEITSDDKTIIGNSFPDFTYGFNVNLNYKNFDLGIFFQGKQGHDIYNLTWADLNTTPQYNNQTTMMLDRWTPNNPDTDVPRAVKDDPNNNNRVSTRFVEDGSYLRIKNIQMGYSFSPDVISYLNLSRLRISASVKNLYTFTKYRGYNPEIGELATGARSSLSRGVDLGVYPMPRIVEAGLEIYF